MAWLERGLGCLRETGLGEGEKMSAMLLLTGFVRGQGRLQADIAAAPESELMASYGRLLARLTDPERFPALHAVIAAGTFDEPDDGDLDFSFGLERVLDGIETLIDKRRIGRG